jgi:ring-1,2-phenylacetyl-CoA epoxidase subunit PaaC
MTTPVNKISSDLSAPTGGQGVFAFSLHLADNALITGQRNAEWCGHGPVLEQDIAITNISLDLIGQARNFYQHAVDQYNHFTDDEKKEVDYLIPGIWKSYDRSLQEDDLAFLREEKQYRNLLITELPKGDWAYTILRQFFFSAFQYYQYELLQNNDDVQLAAIAEKSIKEVTYHLRWSSEWVVRLGDGTDEGKRRINSALDELWVYTGEMFQPATFEGLGLSSIKENWMIKVDEVFNEARLTMPAQTWMHQGGKEGKHTEHLGYLLAEMQFLQRTYPNSTW